MRAVRALIWRTQLARDPHARRLLGAREAAGDLAEPLARCRARPAGISSSGQRSCRCQRSRCWSRGALRRPDPRGGRPAAGSRARRRPGARRGGCSSPSLSAARATAERVDRVGLAALALPRGARPPCASARPARPARRGRSGSARARRDTCRQSSIAHTRSRSSPRAQRSSWPKLPLRAGTVSSPTRGGGERVDRRRRCASSCVCPSRSRSCAPSLR